MRTGRSAHDGLDLLADRLGQRGAMSAGLWRSIAPNAHRAQAQTGESLLICVGGRRIRRCVLAGKRAHAGARCVTSNFFRVLRQISFAGIRRVLSPGAPLQGQTRVSLAAQLPRLVGARWRPPHHFWRRPSNRVASLLCSIPAQCDPKARISHAFASCGVVRRGRRLGALSRQLLGRFRCRRLALHAMPELGLMGL